MAMKEYALEELLIYEQPTKYIVESTDYRDDYKTPVLTAGKSFILGYTNETEGIFGQLPVIIFDDFTTATQYVNFKFKVKSSAMKILHVNQELVHPKYIYYRLQIIQFDHSTHKRYWIQSFSKIRIHIPSIDEQIRIVDEIEELFSEIDSGVETLIKTQEKLDAYHIAVLKNVFGQVDRAAYKELREVINGSPQNGIYKPKSEYGDGCRILRIDGFYDGKMVEQSLLKRLNISNEELKCYGLENGDMVVNRVNSIQYLGKCAYISNLEEPTVFESNMMRLKLNKEKINGEYLAYYLSSPMGHKTLTKNAKHAVNQSSINQTDVGNAMVPVPELGVQIELLNEIKEKISICDRIAETISMTLKQAEAMKNSILKDAFEGRL